MKPTTTCYYKHEVTFGTDFTADMVPAIISNPENNHILHRRQ